MRDGLKETGQNESATQENGEGGNLSLVSGKPSETLLKTEISQNLPKCVSMQLYDLMVKVVEDNISPATVNAACNCASAIHKMLKFNLDNQKRGM